MQTFKMSVAANSEQAANVLLLVAVSQTKPVPFYRGRTQWPAARVSVKRKDAVLTVSVTREGT